MSSDVPAIGSIASRLSDNTAFHAAVDTPLPGQKQEQVRSGSQPNKTSCATAAMNITAGRLEVMQRHAPLVLQDKAADEAHRNPKPDVPVKSERPDKSLARELPIAQVEQKMTSTQGVHTATMASEAYPKQAVNDVIPRQLQAEFFWADTRDSATPMDIDVALSKPHTQSNQTPFGEPPEAAFGHRHYSSFSEWGSCCHEAGASTVSNEAAMLLADDQNDAMDTDESMCGPAHPGSVNFER